MKKIKRFALSALALILAAGLASCAGIGDGALFEHETDKSSFVCSLYLKTLTPDPTVYKSVEDEKARQVYDLLGSVVYGEDNIFVTGVQRPYSLDISFSYSGKQGKKDTSAQYTVYSDDLVKKTVPKGDGAFAVESGHLNGIFERLISISGLEFTPDNTVTELPENSFSCRVAKTSRYSEFPSDIYYSSSSFIPISTSVTLGPEDSKEIYTVLDQALYSEISETEPIDDTVYSLNFDMYDPEGKHLYVLSSYMVYSNGVIFKIDYSSKAPKYYVADGVSGLDIVEMLEKELNPAQGQRRMSCDIENKIGGMISSSSIANDAAQNLLTEFEMANYSEGSVSTANSYMTFDFTEEHMDGTSMQVRYVIYEDGYTYRVYYGKSQIRQDLGVNKALYDKLASTWN